VIRRLSPNNRKIEAKKAKDRDTLLGERMLKAMGRELASIHLGSVDASEAIRGDLKKRQLGGRWLEQATEAARMHVLKDYERWCKTHVGTPAKA
jgi:hypothetical protein